MELHYFYLIAGLMVICASGVVLTRNLLHAALSLSGTFFCTAILYLCLHAEFMAVAQVLVYIGGVVIFALFTILLTTNLGERFLLPSKGRVIGGTIFASVILVGFIVKLSAIDFLKVDKIAEGNLASLNDLGTRFLDAGPTGFILPFEVISVLLLASMIGAVVIARRQPVTKSKDDQ